MRIGPRGMRKYGVTMETTKKVPEIMAMQLRKERSCCEIFESMTSMSEVNLLRIRPMGVVSKNERGACIVLSSKASWIFSDAAALRKAAPIVLNIPVAVQKKPSKLKQKSNPSKILQLTTIYGVCPHCFIDEPVIANVVPIGFCRKMCRPFCQHQVAPNLEQEWM